MSEAKHTPGPWSIEGGHSEDPNYYTLGIDSVPESFTILLYGIKKEYEECGIRGRNVDEQMANARLIAAAPELLEALKALLNECDAAGLTDARDFNWPKVTKDARAAIAKATGETK